MAIDKSDQNIKNGGEMDGEEWWREKNISGDGFEFVFYFPFLYKVGERKRGGWMIANFWGLWRWKKVREYEKLRIRD